LNRNENLDFLLVTRKRSKEQHTKTSDYWYRVLLLKETAVDYALFWWAGAMIMHNLTLIKTVLIIILLLTTSGTLLMWCQIEHNIIVPGAVEESVNWLSATWYY